ncbi:hypothetical protein ACFL3P_05145 [Pseudomonadota bacterium]
MTNKKTVLLLYPSATEQASGQAMKEALQAQGSAVIETVVEHNYAEVLDQLEQDVIPVVVN